MQEIIPAPLLPPTCRIISQNGKQTQKQLRPAPRLGLGLQVKNQNGRIGRILKIIEPEAFIAVRFDDKPAEKHVRPLQNFTTLDGTPLQFQCELDEMHEQAELDFELVHEQAELDFELDESKTYVLL